MDQETTQKFAELNKKLDDIYRSAERTRKIFMWTLILGLATVLLPLIGLLFVIPSYLNTLNVESLIK